jgi:phage portal protein BeeE
MWNRMRTWLKANRTRADGHVGPGVLGPAMRPAGWWRDDHVEQLRNYQSWVYAAVNAIAQETARQRPFLFVNTGQADHEQTPLPHTHPLARLLDHPNPWMTPWELWYLTVLYLELTGISYAIW